MSFSNTRQNQPRNSMATKKAPSTKPSSIKAKLAAGAKAIQAAKKAAGKPAKRVDVNTLKKKPAKTVAVVVEPPLPKIVESKDPIGDIYARCVKRDGVSLTIAPETTAGEYVVIFDDLVKTADGIQLLIGDAIIQGEKLKAFGGKYTQAMISSGRSLDTLKAYRSTAFHTPKKLRLLPYSHLHATVPAAAIEDKERIIKEAAEKAKDGHLPSVKEIKAQVAKVKPRSKPRKTKPARAQKQAKVNRDLTADENTALIELEDTAGRLESQIGGASFLLEAKSEDTMTLREKLATIARFSGQLEG